MEEQCAEGRGGERKGPQRIKEEIMSTLWVDKIKKLTYYTCKCSRDAGAFFLLGINVNKVLIR